MTKLTTPMTAPSAVTEHQFNVERDIQIDAPPVIVWESILEEMGSILDASGNAMKLKVEPWPGGRWFRDLGNNTGHLWGHVQVIKPPMLLEITGPLMMSFPVVNHVAYRITPQGGGCVLSIKHRAFGEIDPRAGKVHEGWENFLKSVKAAAAAKRGK